MYTISICVHDTFPYIYGSLGHLLWPLYTYSYFMQLGRGLTTPNFLKKYIYAPSLIRMFTGAGQVLLSRIIFLFQDVLRLRVPMHIYSGSHAHRI
jgi:hypothetical protein